MAIGGDDAVVFDFAPQIDIGAELLTRRGEDSRLVEERPAATRRRAKDAEYHAARAEEQSVETQNVHSRYADRRKDGPREPDWTADDDAEQGDHT